MAHPGTAYDDPRLGRDPQPAHLDDLVVTTDDHGGVHLNSGIPNRAFHLAAVAVGAAEPGPGGTSWEGAGRIWYAALTGDQVGPAHRLRRVRRRHDRGRRPARRRRGGRPGPTVGVRPGRPAPRRAGHRAPGPGRPRRGRHRRAPATGVVRVRRTGGFAGLSAEADVDLASDDPRVPELRGLAGRVDLAQAAARSPEPQPDRYVYDLDVCGECAQVGEQALTADLERLVELVLDLGHR